ncbi:MAG: hypothetical protein PHS93_06280 [Candidatus Omnitrophica bacterium]|nr:hypothetical protein [Candidatus Omnitrophota bacterium]MDD5352755.1 hypothetical protein [Candidatus Omnitrophota bacterium]MDD5550354.1 hypothetical protein [Candidatus Omnitrophota bacterium]
MRKLASIFVVVSCFLSVVFFNAIVNADEVEDTIKALANEGVSNEVINEVFTGLQASLGQRVEGMLKNGTITQKQYNAIYKNFMSLPYETRFAYKDAYANGGGEEILNKLTSAAHKDPNKDASLKDKAKDLKQQGYTKEQAKEKLKNEGVSAEKLKSSSSYQATKQNTYCNKTNKGENAKSYAKENKDFHKQSSLKKDSVRKSTGNIRQ